MKFTSSQIPEVINNYNVYNESGSKELGLTNETPLPELVAKLIDVSGAGIAGSYNAVIVGHFDSITQTVNFKALHGDAVREFAPGKNIGLNIRGALQYTDSGTNVTDTVGLRYVVRGQVKQLTPGTMKAGDMMNASAQIEVTYMLIEIDGEKVLELDKRNNVYRVDGVDLLEKVRQLT